MALALYRTHRPGTLADVVGQEHVTEPLARALDADRTHHAYLFSGPRGCGKTSTARILARSLNCVQGPTSTPCGTCRSCEDLAPNGPGSIDVVELDAATHRGIDDARELREKAIYAPAASRYRVYIIDEAHQLTPEASNALLKLIEEPPAHLRFIFATTEPDKILATIRSRTFHYPFRLVPARVLIDHLARVCQAEGVPAEPAALSAVARAGAGSVRDSLSVLGQLLAAAGPQGLTHADAALALGLTDDALIDGFVQALGAGSVAEMLGVVDAVISAGHDPRRFVSDVLDRLRDLIVLKADAQAVQSGLIDLPDEAGERLLAQSETLGLAELSHAADLVSAGLSEVKGATAPRLQLELLCARLALHHPGDTLGSVLARLERVEREVAAGIREQGPTGVRAPQPGPGPAAATAPASAPGSMGPLDGGASGFTSPASGAPATDAEVTPAGAGSASVQSTDQPSPAAGRQGRPTAGPPRRPTLSSQRRAPARPAPAAGSAPPSSEGSAGPAPSTSAAAGAPSASDPVAADRVVPPAGPGPSTGAVGPKPTPTAPPPGAAGRAAGEGLTQLAQVAAAWPSVLDRLAQGSRVAWTVFAEAKPLSVSEGVLAVAVPDQGAAAAIAQRGHDLRLREVLLEVLQLDVTVDVVHDVGAVGRAGGVASATQAARGATRPAAAASGSTGPHAAGPAAAPGAAPTSPGPLEGAGHAADAVGAPPPPPGRRGLAVEVEVSAEPDEPSDDDPDVDDMDGLALVTRELGARTISEIEHS